MTNPISYPFKTMVGCVEVWSDHYICESQAVGYSCQVKKNKPNAEIILVKLIDNEYVEVAGIMRGD